MNFILNFLKKCFRKKDGFNDVMSPQKNTPIKYRPDYFRYWRLDELANELNCSKPAAIFKRIDKVDGRDALSLYDILNAFASTGCLILTSSAESKHGIVKIEAFNHLIDSSSVRIFFAIKTEEIDGFKVEIERWENRNMLRPTGMIANGMGRAWRTKEHAALIASDAGCVVVPYGFDARATFKRSRLDGNY